MKNIKTAVIVLPLVVFITFIISNGLIASSPEPNFSKTFRFYPGEKETGVKKRCMEVLVGYTGEDSFDPVIEFSFWGGECFLKIELLNELTSSMTEGDQYFRMNSDTVEINGTADLSYRAYKRADGNFEWEIILNQKPADNRFVYPVSSDGLTFYYQAELTPEQRSSGFERPDSVVGSYAVYHSEKANNIKRRNGYKEIYECGKAFHLYRPRIWDTAGETVWGELEIDTSQGLLKIFAPADFLENAVYPVTIDPTFGNTTAGASFSAPGLHDLIVLYNDYLETGAGYCDSAYIYGRRQVTNFDGPFVKMYAYEHSGLFASDEFVDSTGRIEITSTSPVWTGAPMVNENYLSDGVEYVAAFQAADGVGGANTKLYYDNTYIDTVLTVNDNDFEPPLNLGSAAVTGLRYSVYVVYSLEDSDKITIRRRKLLSGGIK